MNKLNKRKKARPLNVCKHCGCLLDEKNSTRVTGRRGPERIHAYFACQPQRAKYLQEVKEN